jgi:orotate phosphoribosyltransferase
MIMTHVTSRSWTDADIIRLRQLSEQGASVARAAGALNRRTSAVAKVARRHNIELAGVRKLKAALRKLDDEAAFSVP